MAEQTNPHNHHRERLRLRAREEGLLRFSTHEVLELLLFYAIPRVNTNELAHRLLEEFGSLSAVLEADYDELRSIPGMGEISATFLTLLPQFFSAYARDKQGKKPQLDSFSKAGEYCLSLFAGKLTESFWVLCLDTHKQLLHCSELFSGTPGETPIQIRRVVEYALQRKASSVLLAHNHPSGSPEPSAEDYLTTRLLCDALQTIGIAVDDHILIAGEKAYHFSPDDEMDPFRSKKPVLLSAADSPDPPMRRRRKE